MYTIELTITTGFSEKTLCLTKKIKLILLLKSSLYGNQDRTDQYQHIEEQHILAKG